jgi:lactate dehydrogenase-like 2-hydroxyacid dehydrogenase
VRALLRPRGRLREYLEREGHALVVTSDKEGPDSEFEANLADAKVVISQPFWPAYLTAERIAKAPSLKLAITAGTGSDHVDLEAAAAAGVTVAEVTYSNSTSVSEHVVQYPGSPSAFEVPQSRLHRNRQAPPSRPILLDWTAPNLTRITG